VSIENAAANIQAEIPHWNFKQIVAQANTLWNEELNKIVIKTPDTSRLRTFYTAMYHTMIAPSIFNDHNGDYLGTDKKVYRAANLLISQRFLFGILIVEQTRSILFFKQKK
jgi:putative alpha-1,2-mannosidase